MLSYLWLPYMILPIYTGLDRLPDSLLEASADLGARAGRTFRSVVLPMIVPSLVAGSIFTFSLSLGDYITVQIVGGKTQLIGNLVYANIGAANNLPFAAALATIPVSSWSATCWRAAHRSAGRAVTRPLPARRWLLRIAMVLGLGAHLRAAGRRAAQLVQRRPDVRLAAAEPDPRVVGRAWENERRPRALWTSVQGGLGATAIALVLGTMVAFAVRRFRFFGRDAISLLVVLPIALPGIVTGIALDSAYQAVVKPLGVEKGCSGSSSGTRRSAWWWSTTTCWRGCAASAATSRRQRRPGGRRRGRPSGW